MKRISQTLLAIAAIALVAADWPEKPNPLPPDDPAIIAAIRGIEGVQIKFGQNDKTLIHFNLNRLPDVQAVIPLLERVRNVGSVYAQKVATDSLLKCATNWPMLRTLDLIGSQRVSVEGLRRLRGLKNLKYLLLNATCVGDAELKEIGSFSALVDLKLRDTQVTDAGMVYLTNLKHLESLELGGTAIGDKGLESLGQMQSLKDLRLSSTRISDAGIGNLGHLANLQYLSLAKNDLTDAGVAKLKHLRGLRRLELNGTRATEEVVKEFDLTQGLRITGIPKKEDLLTPDDPGDIAALRKVIGGAVYFDRTNKALIHIDLNGAAGLETLIPLLERLHNVRSVSAWSTATDDLLKCARNWPMLRTLDLTNSRRVSDEGVRHLRGLTRLRSLVLKGTWVGDAGLKEIASLGTLVNLFLGETQVTDAGMVYLTNLKHLEYLDLDRTRVGDRGLESLAQVQSLKDLRLYSTQVTDAGIGNLARLVNLQRLSLRRTELTDAGVVKLKSLHQLRYLGLGGTLATEEVEKEFDLTQGLYISGLRTKADLLNLDDPADVAELRAARLAIETNDLRNVTDIDASRCDGPLGDWTLRLKNLHSVVFVRLPPGTTDYNLIRVCDLKTLKKLVINRAGITDAGTKHIGRLTELEELTLSYCRSLTDVTAARLLPLKKLKTLDMASTSITDAGLKQIAALRALKRLRLDDTKITDDGLAAVANLAELGQLELDRTLVTDAGLLHLTGLKKLGCLDIQQTAVTDIGVDRIRKAIPGLRVSPDHPSWQ